MVRRTLAGCGTRRGARTRPAACGRPANDGDDPRASALARVNQANLAVDDGHLDEARQLLDAAEESGLVDATATRPVRTRLAQAADDLDETGSSIDEGSPTTRSTASARRVLLAQRGVLERRQDRSRDAETTFGMLVDAPELELRAAALDHLGDLLKERSDTAGAQARYRQAIELDHPVWSAQATVDLARLLLEDGDAAAARSLVDELLSRNPPAEQAKEARELFEDGSDHG